MPEPIAARRFDMDLNEFIERGEPRWAELETLASESRRKPERLGAAGLNRMVDLYRAASSDLVAARRLFPSDPVVDRLERLVVRTRGLLHDRQGRREGVVGFFSQTYWRLIAERARPMWLSAALLLVPALLGAGWAAAQPERLSALLPPEFLWVTEARSTDVGYSAPELIGFSTYVMTNNIRVTLIAFVAGLTWGLLSSYVIATNGLLLGALAALAVGAGNGDLLVAAVAAHGFVELSCVVVGGGAGLAFGRSLLRPGTKTRIESMADEAKAAAMIFLGTVPWLVLAGVVEGFVSRTGTPWQPALVLGVILVTPFWYMVWRSRSPVGPGAVPGRRPPEAGN